MNLKRELLKKSAFYCIIDREVLHNKSVFKIASRIKESKCPCVIQYRDKVSKKEEIIETVFSLRKLLLGTDIVFIVNDYLDVAKITDADGLHIGQDDISIETARQILGQDKIIGVSTHNLKQAIEAQEKQADYIGVGPVFKTSIKPKYKPISWKVIEEVRGKIKIPFFAIGGIDEDNIKQLLTLGIRRVAVCKAICRARNVQEIIREFDKLINNVSST